MFYHFPAIEDLTQDGRKRYDSRIYEKHRFILPLAYRLGLGKAPTSRAFKYGQKVKKDLGYALFRHQKSTNLPIVATLIGTQRRVLALSCRYSNSSLPNWLPTLP